MKPRRTVAALVILAACSGLQGCSKGWPAFRHDGLRTGNQFHKSRLSDPTKVTNLHIVWTFNAPGGRGFFASPVVHKGKVFIGNGNGFLYALNADTGAVIWQYPPSGGQALTSTFTCNPSSFGIASSATVTKIGGTEAVIFGAPDRSSGAHLGDGHLFALNAQTGALIWESPVLSRITGNGFNDFHEQIGYSSPLVFNGHVYIGIGDHCDNPIQNGRVVSVQLANGAIDPAFSYVSTSARGGGVWTSPAALDDDPDWAAGAAVMLTSCGTLAVSQQKDGWAWSVETATGHVRWGFPTGPWATGGFHTGDGTFHGDTDYKRPGAAWGDVYVASVGGLQTTTNLSAGYSRLHALN